MKELYQHLILSNFIENTAIILNNLLIKTSNNIATYNFIKHSFQLG